MHSRCDASVPVADQAKEEQYQSGEQKNATRHGMRGGVVHDFNLLKNRGGKYSRLSGNIATDHQDDTELADGMRKSERGGRKECVSHHGHRNGKEPVRGRGSQHCGGFERTVSQGGKSALQRTNYER